MTEQREQQAFLGTAYDDALPKQRSAPSTRRSCLDLIAAWWIEIISLLVGVGALVAIAVTLAEYNSKEQPAWKYSVNLNTLIAILSTLLRVCMLYGVEEAVSQMKWLWYRRPRPLRHLDYFDAAVRGPEGSLLLLLRLRRFDAVFIGCLVIIFSVGIGPFTQQAVKSVPCNVPFTAINSTIPISQTNDRGLWDWPRTKPGYFDLDLETKAAVLQGLANPTGNGSALTTNCPTGNCTFPSHNGITHSSIGLCKKCIDVSASLYEVISSGFAASGQALGNDTVQYNLFLPADNSDDSPTWVSVGGGTSRGIFTSFEDYAGMPNLFLNTTAAAVPGVYGLDWLIANMQPEESFLAALRASVVNTSMIMFTSDGCDFHTKPMPETPGSYSYNITCPHPDNASSYWDIVNAVATTCVFYPCVKDYYGVVNDTVFAETLIRETPANKEPYDGNIFANQQHYNDHCIINNQPVTLDNVLSTDTNVTFIDGKNTSVPHECFYNIDGIFLRALSVFLSESLTGGCIMPLTSYYQRGSGPRDWTTVECDGWWLKSLHNRGNATFETINANMEAVAVAVTNEMRRQGTGWDGNPAYAKGFVSRATVCTQFDWVWLGFPVALLLLTMLMLGIVGVKTLLDRHQTPIWKSSALPLLFTGNGVGVLGALDSIRGVEKEAGGAVVTLAHEGEAWEFVGEGVGGGKEGALATGTDGSSLTSTNTRSRISTMM